VPTIDPPFAVDMSSIQIVEDTTVGLVRQNPANAQVELGMATKWDVSADGKVYTFKIRGDVPWVRWDGKKVAKVQTCPDKDGKTKDRLVTAKDFEYGILRTLDAKTAADYAYVLTPVIVGGAEFNEGTLTDTAKVGVKAIDDATLQVTVIEAAAYNVNILGLWVAHAQPSWIIDGDDCTTGRAEKWIEPGFFQGYGAFVLKEWVHDSVLTVVKNPSGPEPIRSRSPRLTRFSGASWTPAPPLPNSKPATWTPLMCRWLIWTASWPTPSTRLCSRTTTISAPSSIPSRPSCRRPTTCGCARRSRWRLTRGPDQERQQRRRRSGTVVLQPWRDRLPLPRQVSGPGRQVQPDQGQRADGCLSQGKGHHGRQARDRAHVQHVEDTKSAPRRSSRCGRPRWASTSS